MAFEGINFGMLPQSEMAQQNQFLQMIGQGIANYQAGQDRKLRERQLEYEMSKGSPMDYKQAAMDELYRMQTTGQTTPQGQAALQVMSQTTAPRQYTDPLGRVVTQPSPWQSLVGGQMTNVDGVTRQQMAERSADVSNVTPDILDYPVDVQGTTQPSALPVVDNQPPQLVINPSASPLEQQKTVEANVDLRKEQAKTKIEESQKAREFELEKKRAMPKAEARMVAFGEKVNNISGKIDDAINKVSPWSAGIGSWLSVVPATDATDLSAMLDTITADAAFGTLQEMRENSKTGGALGSVSERELALLSGSVESLRQDQSPEQLKANLQNYKNIRINALGRVADAFEKDYGYRPKEIDSILEKASQGQMSQEQKYKRLQELRAKAGR